MGLETAPETTNEFWIEFNKHVEAVRNEIKAYKEGSQTVTATTLKCLVSQGQLYANSGTMVLPPFDIRRSQEILEDLGKEVKEAEQLINPRKAFKFSSRSVTVPAAPIIVVRPVSKAEASSSSSAENKIPPGSYPLVDLVDAVVVVNRLDLNSEGNTANSNLFLKNNKGCTISAPTLLGSVRIANTLDCTIHLGPCCTSVYLENCSGCTIFIACHQLRIHETRDCQLYVRVNSHPIIEDCSGLGFAPYAYHYDDIDTDFERAQLTAARDWDSVVDFRWHKNTPSPNWHVIPESERIVAE